MAMSPRYSPFGEFFAFDFRRNCTGLFRTTAGNDSTSVGPFFFLKFSFNRAMALSLTRQTVTFDWLKPSSLFTWRKNDSRGRLATRTSFCWFRIILAEFLVLLLSPEPLLFHSCRRAADASFRSLHRRE